MAVADGVAHDFGMAIWLYECRDRGTNMPAGFQLDNGCWYPMETEIRSCCKVEHLPNERYPYLLRDHMCSFEHIATMYNIPVDVLRRGVRKAKCPCASLSN